MPIKRIDLKNYITPSDYMSFPQGDTRIAIISNSGGMARMHGMRATSGYKNLGICSEDETCEHCKKGYESKLKWIWVIYWIEKGVVRLLEGGKMIGDGICMATQKAGLDNFTQHEYIITATGEKMQRKYSVKLGAKVALTDEEKTLTEPAKKFLINKHLKQK